MSKPLPPTCLLLALLLMLGVHFAMPLKAVLGFPANLLGAAPLFAGILLNILADRSIKRSGTTVKPFQESKAMVTEGVYRISRHPMYLGMVLILTGLAVLLGSATPWVVVLVFLVLLELGFVRHEEAQMEAAFGEEYQAYRRRVRKWL